MRMGLFLCDPKSRRHNLVARFDWKSRAHTEMTCTPSLDMAYCKKNLQTTEGGDAGGSTLVQSAHLIYIIVPLECATVPQGFGGST